LLVALVALEHPTLEPFVTMFVGVCYGGDGRTKHVVAAGVKEVREIRKLLIWVISSRSVGFRTVTNRVYKFAWSSLSGLIEDLRQR
jgi:hypothetical protein